MAANEIFKTFPIIETERLILREIIPEDEEDLLNIFSHEETMQYYGLDTYTSLEDAKDTIGHMRKGYKNRWIIKWAVTLKDKGQFIGLCGFHNWVKSDRRSEIGYILSKDLQGKGIMSEAIKPVMEFGFLRMELNRIEAVVHTENASSLKLLHKFGFEEEGLLRKYKYYNGKYHDFYMFSRISGTIT